jgi:beta-lactamase regulating signal transducer with metallopeptidase domain
MIEWIITSSVLIMVIVTIRYLLRGKISLRVQYAIWALVLVRLLIPFNFGNTGFSVLNILSKNPGNAEVLSTLPGGVSNDVYNLPDWVPSFSIEDTIATTQNKAPHYNEEIPTNANAQQLNWDIFAYTFWLVGVSIVGLLLLFSNLSFAVRVKKSRRIVPIVEYALPIYATNSVDTPCLFGILHPAIYITPEVAEDETVLRHAIEHELTHFRHRDNLWGILRGICLALHWYNPLVWWAAFISRNDSDLACDEATINRLGENERAKYGKTLIEMTCRKRTAILITATTMTSGNSRIKERIMLIAKRPRMAIYTLIIVLLVAAVAVSCTFTGAEKEQESFSPDTVSMSQMLSSALPPGPITDADTVEYLWSLYRSFEFEGTADKFDKGSVWSITVTFSSSDSDITEKFTIFEGGLCQLGDDYKTLHVLRDGKEIYNEFLSYFEAAKEADSISENNNQYPQFETTEPSPGSNISHPESIDPASMGNIDLLNDILGDFPDSEIVPLTPDQITQINEVLIPAMPDSKGNLVVNPMSCFFTSYYDRSEDINLAEFLRYFPGSIEVTDADEFYALKELDNWPFGTVELEKMPVPVHKYLRETIDQVLWKYAGITCSNLSGVGFEEVYYLEEYDAFYNYTSDFAAGTFKCTRGEVEGDTVRLYAEYGDGGSVMLTLQRQNGSYLIISHQRIK